MKKNYECATSEFLETVKDHVMTAVRDDGVDRHLRFRKNGSFCGSFELITWSGHLLITGDYGTYVFRRIEDMFEFFRGGNSLQINPYYWGEKLLSVCKLGGYREFSEERFQEQVIENIRQHFDGEKPELEAKIIADVKDNVFPVACDGAIRAYDALVEYRHQESGFHFIDAWEWMGSCDVYTFHYIWCLYAIVWGINKYDTELVKVESA